MKKKLYGVFILLLFSVLMLKVLGWFINYDKDVDKLINTTMFSFIGIAYLVMGFSWDKMITKLLIIACGISLIVLNFFETSILLNIIGIITIVTPMIIARIDKRNTGIAFL
jgi:hypothetical protein